MNTADILEKARAVLDYDPETGAMTWRASPANNVRVGDEVGSVNSEGYRGTKLNGRHVTVHRLAWLLMTGEWPDDQIDHINGNRADNRWRNLRQASARENASNTRTRQASGYRGVYPNPRCKRKKWCATIRADGRCVYLGGYETPEAAAAAYDAAAKQIRGEFASLNFPEAAHA